MTYQFLPQKCFWNYLRELVALKFSNKWLHNGLHICLRITDLNNIALTSSMSVPLCVLYPGPSLNLCATYGSDPRRRQEMQRDARRYVNTCSCKRSSDQFYQCQGICADSSTEEWTAASSSPWWSSGRLMSPAGERDSGLWWEFHPERRHSHTVCMMKGLISQQADVIAAVVWVKRRYVCV